MEKMRTHLNDLRLLLQGLHNVRDKRLNNKEDIYHLLNKAANDVAVDDFVRFKETSFFKAAINVGIVKAFHYGVLVYDNYNWKNNNTLIPFKYAYSKKGSNPLNGLNKALGKSESNFREFIYGNEHNSKIISRLGFDGYLLFSHNLDSQETKWNVLTSSGEDIDLKDLDTLWKPNMGALNIFKRDFFNFNGVLNGDIYTAVKVIDVDIEGRSSSYLIVNCDNKDTIECFLTTSECQNKIYLLVSAVRSLYTQIHSDFQYKESLKSAKAAIMSRNMSHNLGSHVMSYLKHNLSSVTTMMRDNVLQEIISCGTNNILSLNRHISKEQINDDIALPFLLGLGHFISYIQERQDFIATIATDYIPYNSTVNFKDYIYDELNPDKRFERHIERSNLKIDNILFGNIARSEGLGRFTTPTKGEQSKLCDIVLKFGKFDGNKGSSEEDLEKLRNFDVSLPGGIVGRQAIFSILENVIRNAAKHGNWKKFGKLEFTLEYYTKDTIDSAPDNDSYDGCYNLRKVLESFYKDAQDSDNLYFVTITDNTETEIETLKELRKSLCEDYIDSSKKGLMEMRISASWLRSITEEDKCYNPYLQHKDNDKIIGTDSFPPIDSTALAPILYARLHKPRKYSLSYNLQYIICLPKPRRFAVIINKTDDNREIREEINKLEDFKLYDSIDIFKDQNNKSFDFVICETENIYNEIRPVSSAKTILLSESEIKAIVKNEDAQKGQFIQNHTIDKLFKSIYKDADNEYIVIDDNSVFEKAKALYNDGGCDRIEILAKGKEDRMIIYNIDRVFSFHKNMTNGQETRKEESKEIYEGFPDGIYYRVGNIIVGNATTPIYSMYSYRTHHEANIQFEDFMNNVHGHRIRFVEGITGNNATDRLVRHNALLPFQSNRWFFSHLHAMKQKVAIIDERIFYKIYGIDEAYFVRGNAYLPQTDHLSNGAELSKDLIKAKEHYLQFISDKSLINKAKDMKSLQNIVSLYFSDRIRCDEVYTKGYLGYAYYQKNVMMFTFIPGIEAHEFELVGIQLEDSVVADINISFECKCTPIAKIFWDRVDKKIKINLLNGGYIKFDFISIHQGLLDKLIEAFAKENKETNGHIKNEIIKQFFELFGSHTIPKTDGKSSDFYPGLSIHSGRSKPSEEVLPQRVPFIQYATLEHAILDCKYTLVELLENARYE